MRCSFAIWASVVPAFAAWSEDEIGAAGLQRLEHVLVERGHVDGAVFGDVQIVIVLRDPEQVDLLGDIERAERRRGEVDVAAALFVQDLLGRRDGIGQRVVSSA